jgi:hypothetical protein
MTMTIKIKQSLVTLVSSFSDGCQIDQGVVRPTCGFEMDPQRQAMRSSKETPQQQQNSNSNHDDQNMSELDKTQKREGKLTCVRVMDDMERQTILHVHGISMALKSFIRITKLISLVCPFWLNN